MAKTTPMLQQYFDIKKEYSKELIFFRLGDFYELFGDDAKEAAQLLGLTLTARQKGTPNEIAMCGVPHHSSQKYIAQLTKAGRRVAICDQVSDPNLPGIVKREVVRVITPGTTLDDSVVDSSQNNFLVGLYKQKNSYGIAMMDLGTGEFLTTELDDFQSLKNLLYLSSPQEVVVEEPSEWNELHELSKKMVEKPLPHFIKDSELLCNHFDVAGLEGFGVANMPLGIHAAAMVLHYCQETQKTELDHIKSIHPYRFNDVMMLDESTMRNLELLHSQKDFGKEGSLLQILDKTLTRMGARKLRQWITSPLLSKNKIEDRLHAVEELMQKTNIKTDLQLELKECYDLERLVGRIGCRRANARDLNYLKLNLKKIPSIKSLLQVCESNELKKIHQDINELNPLLNILDQQIAVDPPLTITEGGIIADGFSTELDELRNILNNGKEWLMNYQQKLRDETNISTLKVKFNKVFGYHIEVSKAQSGNIPEEFHLKQTLVNAHRYMSQELSEFAEKYLHAEDQIKTLEYELFQKTLEQVLPYLQEVQKNAQLIARVDVLQSFAQVAQENHYCKPQLSEENILEITNGRHPVIEQMLKEQHEEYIANNLFLNNEKTLTVLTGPNMAGKSSYLRQNALIVLMAHLGSFVPAEAALIGLTDRIFTRVGASDDIARGQSTFMVEMTEAANILNNATEKSLIIFDELGRGTSTYDGVSIAWSILEYVVKDLKSLTLFATHYHELIQVAEALQNASNASIAVSEKDGNVIFLRKVIEKGTDRSYGIEVAKLAGLPKDVVKRSQQILAELEKDRAEEEQHLLGVQPSLFSMNSQQASALEDNDRKHQQLAEHIKKIDPNTLTPLQALVELSEIKKIHSQEAEENL